MTEDMEERIVDHYCLMNKCSRAKMVETRAGKSLWARRVIMPLVGCDPDLASYAQTYRVSCKQCRFKLLCLMDPTVERMYIPQRINTARL